MEEGMMLLERVDKRLKRIEEELRELKEFSRKLKMSVELMDLVSLRWAVEYILCRNRKYEGYEMYRVRRGDGINSTRTKWVRHPFF